MVRADAARKVQLATALDGEGLAVTRAAFDAGDVSSRCVGIIAAAMDKLPETLTDVERVKVETSLVQKAQQLNPGRFYRAAKFALADAERSAAEVAEHVEAQLVDQECRAYRLATVTMQDLGDGTTRLQALLPTFTARMLGKVLQSMTAPRRDHLRQAAEAALADGQTAAGDLSDGSVAADLHASTRQALAPPSASARPLTRLRPLGRRRRVLAWVGGRVGTPIGPTSTGPTAADVP
ncbi:MAG: DUF222 domain-containing protein [Actinomycetales bacterium]|nr:DUF222 domain-containing protein [Actinomycetales bacterium]